MHITVDTTSYGSVSFNGLPSRYLSGNAILKIQKAETMILWQPRPVGQSFVMTK